jgi:hypothetical protein
LSYSPFFAGIRSCPAANLASNGALFLATLFLKEFMVSKKGKEDLSTVKIGHHYFHKIDMERRAK